MKSDLCGPSFWLIFPFGVAGKIQSQFWLRKGNMHNVRHHYWYCHQRWNDLEKRSCHWQRDSLPQSRSSFAYEYDYSLNLFSEWSLFGTRVYFFQGVYHSLFLVLRDFSGTFSGMEIWNSELLPYMYRLWHSIHPLRLRNFESLSLYDLSAKLKIEDLISCLSSLVSGLRSEFLQVPKLKIFPSLKAFI